MSIDGEQLVRFPKMGFFESIRESKREKKCAYCKKIVKENPWWNFWSFSPFCEIGVDSKTGQWTYVCEACTKTFVNDFVKQIYSDKRKLVKKKKTLCDPKDLEVLFGESKKAKK